MESKMTNTLSPESRTATLDALAAEELDILVVGGGVVGAGAALDAVSRGLTVGMVEARDWAAGTSSRSSKLVHGGLRYLEMFDFALVREALKERGLLLQKLAPHLVRPVGFLYPLTHRVWERAYVTAGVTLYDTMGVSSGNARGLPHHRQLTKKGIAEIAPALRSDAMVGAIQYYDGQVDDARHTFAVVRTAAAQGALCVNRARVQKFIRENDRVVGAEVLDTESGQVRNVRAKVVVNATGVWTDDSQKAAGTDGDFHVRASKGVHILIPRERLDLHTGLILKTEKSVLFVIPWGLNWIIGTTDTDWDHSLTHPSVSAGDIEYLLEHVNKVLKEPLTKADITGTYAGLRPLVAGASASTAKLSREHVVGSPVPGLIVVAGGKYTTYRVMGADAVDEAVKQLGREVPESVTENVPLSGADGFAAVKNSARLLASRSGLPPEAIEHLLGRYGSLTTEVLELLATDPSLGELLPGSSEYRLVEAVYAVSHEQARHLEDVLVRRLRMSIESRDRGAAAAEPVARLMAPLLGWDDTRTKTEVETYRERVAAEENALTKPDDVTADAARLAAPDIEAVLEPDLVTIH
jgi:glycerol-3-phosphate dehydrogenase